MTKRWKSPLILRLSRIEAWGKARFKSAIQSRDTAKALKAANLYTAASARANGLLGSMIRPDT
ncbi:hypothetical protein [Bradyrhizobium betae]|uniref:Uncharacterized protein n=1 Tax=Bradyrhizobium betae TaxID=244734 RepID=A0A5P6P4F4_9BRAD|nr:hypothetical protein [Bradyrhizobium betae]MCS3731212.1 hypothetical protein [Bradyrhizobium betae]QFI73171.1 hypothetical protein F8237_12660 [Bradyrhizobium betae]